MSSHHSYVIYTTNNESGLVVEFIDKQGFLDVVILDVENFGIDDSRNLIKLAYRQPSEGNNKKLIVVKPHIFTLEAQQALLKILEEPPNSTVFLFVLQNSNLIIPTLKSRFLEYRSDEELVKPSNLDFKELINLDYKDRLLFIAKKIDKDDTEWLRAVKSGLVTMLSESFLQFNSVQRKSLTKIIMNLGTRGASNKMLLEEMALSIPYTA